MAKRPDLRSVLAARALSAQSDGHQQADTAELSFAADQARAQEQRQQVELERIQARSGKDIRPTNPLHVVDLAESIVAVGLIEPLVVDRELRLVAGGHRLAALRLLALAVAGRTAAVAAMAAEFAIERGKPVSATRLGELQTRAMGLPVHAGLALVRVIGDLDAATDLERAFQVEVAENEKRRDYTPGEIRGVADRLKRSGRYQLTGRPGQGRKAMLPELAAIFGKSQRQIYRALAGLPGAVRGKSAIRQTFNPTAQRTAVLTMGAALPKEARFDRLRALFGQVADELKALDG
jgi:ParB family transcriptional regulator, chromosome partitioning protein